jgi:transposase
MTRLSQNQIKNIKSLLSKNKSEHQIAADYNCGLATIQYHVRKLGLSHLVHQKWKPGRPKKITKKYEIIVKNIIKSHKSFGSRKLVPLVRTQTGLQISDQTLRNFRHSEKIRWEKPVYTPTYKSDTSEQRLLFARKYVNSDFSHWVFSGEKTFAAYQFSGGKNDLYHPPNLHVWWAISLDHDYQPFLFTKHLNAKMYCDTLEKRLPDDIPDGYLFVQDQDPKHMSKTTENWFAENNIDCVEDWPPSSPDLNPLKTLWAIIERHVYARLPTNHKQLVKYLNEAIASIKLELIQHLFDTYKDRLRAVIESKGRHTKY